MTDDPQRPEEPKVLFRVEAADLTAEELAALTVVLAAATAGGEQEPTLLPVGGWASPARQLRQIIAPGFGAWRAEYQPR